MNENLKFYSENKKETTSFGIITRDVDNRNARKNQDFFFIYLPNFYANFRRCCVMVKAPDCGNCSKGVHFRTSALGKGMNSLILPAMG